MQLSLLSRTAPSSSDARTGPSTLPGAWRDSAISQLDTLAATNERVALQTLPGRIFAAAGLAVAMVLGAAVLWPAPRTPAATPAVPASAAASPEARPGPEAVAVPADPQPPARASVSEPTVAMPGSEEALLPAMGIDDDEARKARALRRKAALLAQERERADEEARRQMQALAVQREEAERTRQDEARQVLAEAARERAAAEQARRSSAPAPSAPLAVRRSVADLCAGSGGLVSEQACQVRACWRAEHRADPVCVQLRDAEALRLQRGTEH